MANPQRGELEFQIGGKAYKFFFGTYALAKLERRMGKGFVALAAEVQANGAPSVELTLAIFHAGLSLHHESITEKEASLLLDDLRMPVFWEHFSKAKTGVFAAADDSADPTTPAVTPKAANGNGIPFSGNG